MALRSISEIKQQFDRVFRQARVWRASAPPVSTYVPAVDVTRTPQQYRIHVDLPGTEREDIQLHVTDSALTLTGKRDNSTDAGVRSIRAERSSGRFRREIPLPLDADFQRVSATLADGVLEIAVDRQSEATERKIEVQIQ